MGLILNSIELFLIETQNNCIDIKNKNLLILGYQQIYFNKSQLSELLSSYNKKINHVQKSEVELIELFKDLNFKNIDVLDISSYEGANIIEDMNKKIQNKKLENYYDFILDWGTIEHVFNIPNYLSNINFMLNKNGYYYGVTPINGWLDHGFYQFSPTFFYDVFKKNWQIIFQKILHFNSTSIIADWDILKYNIGNLDIYAMGGIDSGMYQNFFCIKKKNNLNLENINQTKFQLMWQKTKTHKKTKTHTQESSKYNFKNLIAIFLNKFFSIFGYQIRISKLDYLKNNTIDTVLKEHIDYSVNSFKRIKFY